MTQSPSGAHRSFIMGQLLLQWGGYPSRRQDTSSSTKLLHRAVRRDCRSGGKARCLRAMLRKTIQEDCFEERFVNLDAAVVVNEPEFAKAVHEEADAGAGSADHLCKGLLSDGRNELCRFSGLTVFGHQKEEPRQALFAGIEVLIEKICLGSHAASQDVRQEQIGECLRVAHHSDHLTSSDFHRIRRRDCSDSGRSVSSRSGKRILSNKVAGGKQRNRRFLAVLGNDSDFQPSALEIENRIGRVPLGEKGVFWIAVDNCSAYSSACKKLSKVEARLSVDRVNPGVSHEIASFWTWPLPRSRGKGCLKVGLTRENQEWSHRD